MKILTLCFVVALTTQCLHVNAQLIYPKTPFNKAEAEAMIGKDGTCTIKGQVAQKGNYLVNLVELYPCTAYFNEFMEMRKKDKKGKKPISMSDEAYSYRILTIIQQDGSFEFKGLNPGKYYLQTRVIQTKVANGEKQVGTETTTTYNGHGVQIASGSTPIMEKTRYLYQEDKMYFKYVDVAADGQVVTLIL
ncbi:hypothetical protein SAMN05444266_103152 [Chitinophaga jiangningensis]|uniref:Carboxypeptidase regulatory-like domain-containing protein n=1 Tax=Chitinophaga jiangningensis TaxID=1419482 RepID=A0A1M7A710_9BACT|nr:hypothetical protein [Chitinophaga jiangningensis]SHL38453.1 hypothetical protein SAMN05444266_103152 [Chitinophaga jiangningensis]